MTKQFKIERGFDVINKDLRIVETESHLPTIKIVLPACRPEDMEAFDLRDEISKMVESLLNTL